MSALLNKHAFGLHISDGVAKFAELVPSGNTFQVIAYGQIKLPPKIVVDGMISDPKILTEELKGLINKPLFGQISTRFVYCSIPESRVFLKTITTPKFKEKELKEAVLWEARSLLPLPQEHAYYESQIIEEKDHEVHSLVAATEKALVDGYMRVIQSIGLIPIGFDLECYATARAISEQQLAKHVFLQAHIGTRATMLSILRDGRVWFSHALPTGIGLLESQGRLIPNEQGNHEDFIHALTTGINSTINYFQQQIENKEMRVEGVLLTGSFASLPGLIQGLQKTVVSLPVLQASPRLVFAESLHFISPLSTSIGVGLRGAYPAKWTNDLNFLPEMYADQLEAIDVRVQTKKLLGVLVVVEALVLIFLIFLTVQLFTQILSLRQQIGEKRQIVDTHTAKKLYPWVKETNTRLSFMAELENIRLSPALLLRHIANTVPDGVQLKTILFAPAEKGKGLPKIKVSGTALSRAKTLSMREGLAGDSAFSNITVPLSSFNDDANTSFTIVGTVDPNKL